MQLKALAQRTLAGATEEALSATELKVKGFILTTPDTNSGVMYVIETGGGSTRFVRKIAAGTEVAFIPDLSSDSSMYDLSQIYVIGTTGDKVNVGYMIRS